VVSNDVVDPVTMSITCVVDASRVPTGVVAVVIDDDIDDSFTDVDCVNVVSDAVFSVFVDDAKVNDVSADDDCIGVVAVITVTFAVVGNDDWADCSVVDGVVVSDISLTVSVVELSNVRVVAIDDDDNVVADVDEIIGDIDVVIFSPIGLEVEGPGW